jgi:type II secretory pathway predicted ATPase ExeA
MARDRRLANGLLESHLGTEMTMYHSYFGMKQRPFRPTPQLGTYYLAPTQEEATAILRYAVNQGRGVALLTGAPGTGKTIVAHRLASNLDTSLNVAMITNTNMSTPKGLLQAILYDLALPYHGMDEQELRLTLTDSLLGKYASGERTVLIVDEAQNLTAPLLEELRMLGNIEGESEKLIQIVLVGHPRLMSTMQRPELDSLCQRIAARATLRAMTEDETCGYIRHQLAAVDVSPDDVFSANAMKAVYAATAGVPRLVNHLCEHSLLLASIAESRSVDVHLVKKASAELNAVEGEAIGSKVQAIDVSAAPIAEEAATHEPARGILRLPTFNEPVPAAGSISKLQPETVNAARPAKDDVRIPATPSVEELFDDEEILLDRYARMDAAKSNRGQSRPAAAAAKHATKATLPHTKLPATLPVATPGIFGDCSTIAMAGDTLGAPPSSPTFVQASDNPAVHEVGAVDSEPAAPAESPLLVVENRADRSSLGLVRLDKPESGIRSGVRGGYRRLFTHARRV